MRKLKILFVIGFLSWMMKHFLIFPIYSFEDHDITGISGIAAECGVEAESQGPSQVDREGHRPCHCLLPCGG